jgi:hypothetical protein
MTKRANLDDLSPRDSQSIYHQLLQDIPVISSLALQ